VKRIVSLVILVVLAVPALAVARRIATGSTRSAIVRAALGTHTAPQRCLLVYVSTVGGGPWATIGFNEANARSCAGWEFDGVDILRRVHGRWRGVASGSSMIPCGRLGIPRPVRRELRLPCR
jgi:hypothetical protein